MEHIGETNYLQITFVSLAGTTEMTSWQSIINRDLKFPSEWVVNLLPCLDEQIRFGDSVSHRHLFMKSWSFRCSWLLTFHVLLHLVPLMKSWWPTHKSRSHYTQYEVRDELWLSGDWNWNYSYWNYNSTV